MRIAVWHNLPSGGGKRALYNHVRGLVGRGHVLESWCPPTVDPQYLPLNELIREHVVPFHWSPKRPRGRIRRALANYTNIIDKLRAMDEHCKQCAEEINQRGFDLLFSNTCQFFGVSSRVIYLQEPHRVLYEAIPRLPWLALPSPDNGRRWPGLKFVKRFVKDLITVQGLRVQAREEQSNARAFDAILVNSYFSRECTLRAYGVDAKTCYLGVDTKLFIRTHRPKEDLVVGVGAFVPTKNIRFIIQALAHLPDPRPHFIWIGNDADTGYFDELRQLALSNGVSYETRLRISDTELVDTLNRALLLAYAPRLEPFGLVPLEANACGTPVVAVAEGGVRETVIDGLNGILVEPDPRAMAAAIQRLRDDHAYATHLGQNGYDLVSHRWSLEASLDRLEQRFTEVIHSPLISKGILAPAGATSS